MLKSTNSLNTTTQSLISVMLFFSVLLHPDSQYLLAFTFKGRHLTRTRLPQGFVDSPKVHIAVLGGDLQELIASGGKVLLQYADDLLIESPATLTLFCWWKDWLSAATKVLYRNCITVSLRSPIWVMCWQTVSGCSLLQEWNFWQACSTSSDVQWTENMNTACQDLKATQEPWLMGPPNYKQEYTVTVCERDGSVSGILVKKRVIFVIPVACYSSRLSP